MNKKIKIPVAPSYPDIPLSKYIGDVHYNWIKELENLKAKNGFNTKLTIKPHNIGYGASIYIRPHLSDAELKLLTQYEKDLKKYNINMCKFKIANEQQKLKELQNQK